MTNIDNTTHIDTFDIISNTLAAITNLSDIILMGDFNIRTGCINYFNDMNDYKAHGGDFVYDIVPLSYTF